MTPYGAGEHPSLPEAPRALAEPRPEAGPDRLAWADLARLVSIFAVVLLHVAAPLVARYGDAERWWIGNVYDSAVRWCVPLFVMLSGALLLGRGLPPRGFFGRRLQRVVVPFVAWSVIYLAWNMWFRDAGERPLRTLLEKPAHYHLWFFYMLLGLYLVAPIVDIFLRAARRREVLYLVALWFAWASLLPVAERFAGVELFVSGGSASSPLRFLGYFVLGGLLRDTRLHGAGRAAAFVAFCAAVALTAGATFWLTARNGGRLDELFYEYWSPNVVVMSVALFLWLKSARTRSRALRPVSGLVLGVYLVHALVLDLLKSGRLGFELEVGTVHPALGVPLLAGAVFAVSLGIAALLRALPVVRRIVP